jgi:putative transcriptional regulator
MGVGDHGGMGTASLTGRLLVATPALGDRNFDRTVVLLLDHDADGALGVVINRPTQVAVGDILPPWSTYASEPGVVFQGGPVSSDSALGLASLAGVARDDNEPLGFRRLYNGIGLIDLDAPPEVLIGEMSSLRIFAGYAGWAAEQVESEISEGAWYVVDAEPADPFSFRPGELWRHVLRRQGGDLAMVATYPEDPTMN